MERSHNILKSQEVFVKGKLPGTYVTARSTNVDRLGGDELQESNKSLKHGAVVVL